MYSTKWNSGGLDGKIEDNAVACANGQILVGNASGYAEDVALSGDATIDNTGALTIAADSVERSMVAQEAAESYPIDLTALRTADLAGPLAVSDSQGAGDHYLALSSNTIILYGNSPSSSTETDTSYFTFSLPPEYDDGQTITLRVNCLYTADGDTKTVEAQVYKVNKTSGAVGSNLVSGGAQALTASAAATDFTVDPTGLVGGDLFNCKLITVFEDSNGTVGEAQVNSIEFLLDITG